MSNTLQDSIQFKLDQGIHVEKIREEMPDVPFKDWARSYLGCSRRVACVTPWDDGTDFEQTMITGTLRRLATREGMNWKSAFFVVFEIMHGYPHPDA